MKMKMKMPRLVTLMALRFSPLSVCTRSTLALALALTLGLGLELELELGMLCVYCALQATKWSLVRASVAVSVSVSHCCKHEHSPTPNAQHPTSRHIAVAFVVYPQLLISPYWQLLLMASQYLVGAFVLRQFMLDCIDWLAALVVPTPTATPIVCSRLGGSLMVGASAEL